jgi:hypothetical protein
MFFENGCTLLIGSFITADRSAQYETEGTYSMYGERNKSFIFVGKPHERTTLKVLA